MESSDPRILRLAAGDNVGVAARALAPGDVVRIDGQSIRIGHAIPVGHKFALRPIARDETILKYNCPIGHATEAIAAGDYVHTHNVASDYLPTYTLPGS